MCTCSSAASLGQTNARCSSSLVCSRSLSSGSQPQQTSPDGPRFPRACARDAGALGCARAAHAAVCSDCSVTLWGVGMGENETSRSAAESGQLQTVVYLAGASREAARVAAIAARLTVSDLVVLA